MKSYFVLFLLCIVSSSELVAQKNSWTSTKDLELAFRIDLPGEAIKNSQNVPTAKGDVEMISYTLNSDNSDNMIYMTSFSKYPSSFFLEGLDTFEKRSKVLDGSVNGAVANVKGKLISDTKIVFNGYDGRIIKMEINSGGLYIIRMKMILVDFKLYMMQTISTKEKDDNPDTQRFFDSFELINVKQ